MPRRASPQLVFPAGRVLGVALVALAVSACAVAPTADNPLGGGPLEAEEVEILVRNDNFATITVYTARHGSSLRRLGTVQGKGTATFKTEWYLPEIQLRVKFLAGPDYLTEVLPVTPGDLLELIIPIS